MKIFFTQSAAKEWNKLSSAIKKRLKEKLIFILSQDAPLKFAKPMRDKTKGDYRFRIGDYRVIFDVDDHTLTVLRVGHRKNVYR